MSEIILKLSGATSRIHVIPDALNHIEQWVHNLGTPPVVLVCSDDTVGRLYGTSLIARLCDAGVNAHLLTFPPGDASKCLSTLDAIYRKLGELRLARDGMLLALGGGVVSDLTGFAAATWMRGVRYLTCPTTLEADVDASIGGKTGINHSAGKNMVGAFHHPSAVIVDPKCLQTLPARDIAAGLAESIKHALIADAELLAWHEQNADAIRRVDPAIMAELITRNLRIKAEVVQSDEREHGRRAILNFGHTIGHAIEKTFQYELRHGEAVALGMLSATDIARRRGLLTDAESQRIAKVIRMFDLPVQAPRGLDVDAVATLTHGDKKVHAGRRRWVLLDGIGATVVRDDVTDDEIRAAIAAVNP